MSDYKHEEEELGKSESTKYKHYKRGLFHKGGLFLDNRTLRLMAGGAMGAMAAMSLGGVFNRLRPAMVSAVREGYGFAEWLAAKAEKAKEDVEDIAAEAVYGHHQDKMAAAEVERRERELQEAVERLVEQKLAKMKFENKEEMP
jgi:hypothetical protein